MWCNDHLECYSHTHDSQTHAYREWRLVTGGGGGGGIGLGVHVVVVGFLEDNILEERDGVDVLTLHGTVLSLLLTYDKALGLWLEEDTSSGDGGCIAVFQFIDADAAEPYLEDTDAIETDLLTQFEEVLQGTTQLIEDSLDVALLHRGLGLDELGQLLGLNELVVVDRLTEVLLVGGAETVVVLILNEFLTHTLMLN